MSNVLGYIMYNNFTLCSGLMYRGIRYFECLFMRACLTSHHRNDGMTFKFHISSGVQVRVVVV